MKLKDSEHSRSIFSQGIDRAAFVAYFLGAVVPLLALATIVQRYVLPTLPDTRGTAGMIGLVGSIAVLSLASFLILRRTVHRSIERIDRDNQRLSALLRTSAFLPASEHSTEISARAVSCAIELTGARAAFLLTRGKNDGDPPELIASAGDVAGEIFETAGQRLLEYAELAISEGQPVIKQGGDGEGIEAAVVLPLGGESAALGALAVVHTDPAAKFDDTQIDAVATLAGVSAVALHNADLRDSQRNFFSHMTEILVTALDAHLDYHDGHGNRVAQCANRIGRMLELDETQLQNLHFGALLHDVGMLKLDRALQKNPRSCEKHTVLGYRMLGRIQLWEPVAPIVLNHHEWHDGTGYPEGLAGDAIPIESRVISVCDAFDSMTSDTSYKVAMPEEAAIEELRAGAGTQFDPRIVEAFVGLLERGELPGRL
jgi:HD-GYP domain-containing protein (c-di-GMP phosphodiesterase class II)